MRTPGFAHYPATTRTREAKPHAGSSGLLNWWLVLKFWRGFYTNGLTRVETSPASRSQNIQTQQFPTRPPRRVSILFILCFQTSAHTGLRSDGTEMNCNIRAPMPVHTDEDHQEKTNEQKNIEMWQPHEGCHVEMLSTSSMESNTRAFVQTTTTTKQTTHVSTLGAPTNKQTKTLRCGNRKRAARSKRPNTPTDGSKNI